MFSQAEENYLKAIYALQNELQKNISTNIIAKKMSTKASSVTDMLKKLALKDLVVYKKYQGVSLTTKGSIAAVKVIRKHRLWEYFLVEKLHYQWDEVHEIAEQLEHVKSESLVDKLDDFLGNPKYDPHGDPIPDKNGKVCENNSINILELQIGQKGKLDYVKDSSEIFLQYLNNNNLALGDTMEVVEIEPFDNSMQIKLKNGLMTISKNAALNLYLKIQENDL